MATDPDEPKPDEAWRSLLQSAGRVARTVANLHPAQLAFAPLQVARSLVLAHVPQAAEALRADRPAVFLHRLYRPDDLSPNLVGLDAELERATLALSGRLELLGREFDFSTVDGRLEALSLARPYRLELAAADVTRSLALASRTEGFADRARAALLARTHLDELLAADRSRYPEVWEPQVVTARFFNLLAVRELVAPDDETLALEAARHARWLAAMLEVQSPSTRLAEQAAALFVASCVLDTAGVAGFRAVATTLLYRSARQDVLPDGGHVSRSSTLAAQYLQRMLLVLAAAKVSNTEAPAGLEAAVDRLARQLVALSHPQGRPPAWRDSSEVGAPWPVDLAGALALTTGTLHEALLGRVANVAPPRASVSSRFDDTGVLALNDEGSHLVVFAAPPGPGDAARHAHADFGSFEISHRGATFTREPGAGTFEPDAWRDYIRSPRAHSTISVDGEGPDELWGGFFVGAKGHREPVAHQTFDGGHVLRLCVHAPQGWRHERLMVLLPDALFAVFDRVLDAPAESKVISHVHLPVGSTATTEDALALVEASGRPWLVERLLGDAWSVIEGERDPPAGWSAPRLGAFEPSPVLAIESSHGGRSHLSGWAVALSSKGAVHRASPSLFDLQGRVTVRVLADARGLRWHLPGEG